MRLKGVPSLIILLLASPVLAQQSKEIRVGGRGIPDERASTRVSYWSGDAAAGQFQISYGRPAWNKDYDNPAKFDAITKGQVWRMGSNFWTELYTNLPLTISGKSVAPGFYFLGLQRSADGASWALAFFDPAKVGSAHIDALYISTATVEFTAPMTVDAAASEPVEKLTIILTYPPNNIHNATLKVAWGHLALTAPIKVTIG